MPENPPKSRAQIDREQKMLNAEDAEFWESAPRPSTLPARYDAESKAESEKSHARKLRREKIDADILARQTRVDKIFDRARARLQRESNAMNENILGKEVGAQVKDHLENYLKNRDPAEGMPATLKELHEIYGDKIPATVLEMHNKINDPTVRADYVAQRCAQHEEELANGNARSKRGNGNAKRKGQKVKPQGVILSRAQAEGIFEHRKSNLDPEDVIDDIAEDDGQVVGASPSANDAESVADVRVGEPNPVELTPPGSAEQTSGKNEILGNSHDDLTLDAGEHEETNESGQNIDQDVSLDDITESGSDKTDEIGSDSHDLDDDVSLGTGLDAPAQDTSVNDVNLDDDHLPLFAEDQIFHNNQNTTSEWRKKFEDVMNRAEGVMSRAKESFKNYPKTDERLIRRNEELDAQFEKFGVTEKGFRWLGEKYNSLPFKYKLAIGAGLGLGAAFTAGTVVSVPLLLGIASQRAAGLASMYMKFEKSSYDKVLSGERGIQANKGWALGKAAIYTVVLGATMKEGIALASETDIAQNVGEKINEKIVSWLGSVWPSSEEIPVETPASAPPDWNKLSNESELRAPTPPIVDVHAEPEILSAPEIAAESEPAEPTIPEAEEPAIKEDAPIESAERATEHIAENEAAQNITIEARPGRGYEDMAWRLWSELKEAGAKPEDYPDKSDIRTLLEADEKTISEVVHDLAKENKYFDEETRKSGMIRLGDVMSVKDGEILINGAAELPKDLPQTPEYIPEDEGVHSAGTENEPGRQAVEAEQAVTYSIPGSEPAGMEQQAATVQSEIDLSKGNHPELNPNPENVEIVDKSFVINKHDLVIRVAEPHLYTDASGRIMAYGSNGDLDALAEEYAKKNHVSVFVDKSYKLLGFINTARSIEFTVDSNGQPTMVVHNGPSLVPDPTTFTKRII